VSDDFKLSKEEYLRSLTPEQILNLAADLPPELLVGSSEPNAGSVNGLALTAGNQIFEWPEVVPPQSDGGDVT
jgi:hypothetical protein